MLLASADDRPATGSRAFRLRRSASAELGAAVRLFALAPHDFGLAARHEGAVETEIEGEGVAELAFDDAAFFPGDLAPESPGVALHRLGCCSASSFDPSEAMKIKALPRRSTSNWRAEQQSGAAEVVASWVRHSLNPDAS